MNTTLTLRLDDEVKNKLEKLAESTHRSRSFLAAEAIKAYVDSNEWHVSEIHAALTEADAGDFASDDEVKAVFKKMESKINNDADCLARGVVTIESQVNLLLTEPAIGRPGRMLGTREPMITNMPHLVPYRIKNNKVEILRVLHTSHNSDKSW